MVLPGGLLRFDPTFPSRIFLLLLGGHECLSGIADQPTPGKKRNAPPTLVWHAPDIYTRSQIPIEKYDFMYLITGIHARVEQPGISRPDSQLIR